MKLLKNPFIVVSGGAEGAAEDFKFVREEAMRLGAPLTTLAENFARMRAAAGDKMALKDLYNRSLLVLMNLQQL